MGSTERQIYNTGGQEGVIDLQKLRENIYMLKEDPKLSDLRAERKHLMQELRMIQKEVASLAEAKENGEEIPELKLQFLEQKLEPVRARLKQIGPEIKKRLETLLRVKKEKE